MLVQMQSWLGGKAVIRKGIFSWSSRLFHRPQQDNLVLLNLPEQWKDWYRDALEGTKEQYNR